MKKIAVRCPVCKDWGQVDEVALGMEQQCFNCGQTVVPVPRSRAARVYRRAAVGLIVLLGVWLFVWLYEMRVQSMKEALGGWETPNLSAHRR